nr:heterogeneous nuclear ribonucleoprotein l [Hymenolepis microstoma]CDS35018.2 heterogeneous nuclear ribonucleoprotein l [Hymenolepis microstoma]
MSRKRNRPEEWGDIEPSPVVHITDLPEHTLEIDLEKLFDRFGHIVEIIMLPNKRQSLIEFEDQNDADRVVQRAENFPFMVGNQRLRLSYSTSKRLKNRGRLDDSVMQNDRSPPPENNILLLTIYNAQYPITVDIIHQVTSRHGKVLRIVIFRKTGVQAMVEFESIEDARETKRHINGADIYSGCCSIKVEYAKQTRLKVVRNCLDSWDYENPNLDEVNNHGRHSGSSAASLLGKFDGDVSKRPDAFIPGGLTLSPNSVLNALAVVASQQHQQTSPQNIYSYGYPDISDRTASPVIMVYNLNMNYANCDRLFNLFCLYGDVGPIKFLRSKEGTAMVELHGIANANSALANLPMVTFAGNKLSTLNEDLVCGNVNNDHDTVNAVNHLQSHLSQSVSHSCSFFHLSPYSCIPPTQGQLSRQQHIVEVTQPFTLLDGTPSFKDFTNSRNNRYTHGSAAKNRVYPPCRMLHFWNSPPGVTASQLQNVFAHAGAPVPTYVSFYHRFISHSHFRLCSVFHI